MISQWKMLITSLLVLRAMTQIFFSILVNSDVFRVGVGVDNIDLKAATEMGVRVCITSDKPSVAVAELCIGNTIALIRHTHKMSEQLKKGIWAPIQGVELRNCVFGIVGLGSIGKELAKRLVAFGCKVKSCSRSWNEDFALEYEIERQTLPALFEECNVVSVHLPFDQTTKGVISEKLINSMQKGSIIINTSRAGVMDNGAVATVLKMGHLTGAAIDVFDEEPSLAPYTGYAQCDIESSHWLSHKRNKVSYGNNGGRKPGDGAQLPYKS